MTEDSKKVKRRVGKKGKQVPLRAVKDTKTIGPPHRQKHDRVKGSSFEPPDSYRELVSESGDLPGSYGETRIVLLPVEPYLLHVYWEVGSVELQKAREDLGDQYALSQAILRFYDVTNIVFDRTNARGFFDVDVDLEGKNSYVRVQSPDRSYCVELGLKTEDGRFHPITRSDVVATPPAWASHGADEDYMLVEGDYDLLEKVPMPADMQLPDKVTSHTAPRGEGGLPLGSERGHPQGAGIGAERGEPFKPEVVSIQRTHSQQEKGSDPDLTEMSEKGFAFGVSSKVCR
jgi:hypothetical protein